MKKIDMAEALDMLGFAYPHGKQSFDIECPFCSSQHSNKRKTMNVNLAKGEGGVFSCLRCNTQGHVITFWREVKGLSNNKEAAKDIQKGISGNIAPVKKKRKVKPENPLANIETRSRTFDALLDSLVLNDVHMQALKERGLSSKFIAARKYRSIPQTSHKEIANVLLDKGFILDGVPGFYKKNEWEFAHYPSGILIPQRDGFGRIQGFQLRMDDVSKGKYLNLTSRNYPHGTATKAFVHLSYNRQKSVDEIILTEGALKADTITFLSNKTVLSIPGVNSTRFLPQALHDLKMKGVKKIAIAFDMDMYSNPNVYRALCNLKNLIRDADIPFCTYEWDPRYKGLDDFLKEKTFS